MGIFEAISRGHTGEEDMLSSSVFGILEILDRSKFLAPVLEHCGIALGEEMDPGRLSFSFWESTGKRTPDVILKDKSILISVESKLGEQVDSQQLVDEYEDGMKLHKNFWLVAVTADYVKPTEIEKAKSVLRGREYKDPRVKWVNWQQIYSLLRRNAKNGNETEQKLIGDLLSLLEAKGLSMFDRFNETQLSSVAALWPEVTDLFHKCSALLGSLSSRLHEKNITCIEKTFNKETVLTGIRSRMALQDFGRWLPGGIGMRMWDNEWKERDPRQGFLLRLWVSPSTLEVGYRLGFGKNLKLRRMFSEAAQNCTLAEKLYTVDACVVSYYGSGYKLLNRETGDSLNDKTFSLKALENTRFLMIGRRFNQEEIVSPRLVDEIEKCLLQMRDIVNKNDLYFSGQAIYDTEEKEEEEEEEVNSEGQLEEKDLAED